MILTRKVLIIFRFFYPERLNPTTLHKKSYKPSHKLSTAIESATTHPEPKRMKRIPKIPSSSDQSHPLPNLPHELIVEILSRLPVKPLLQFRSVCKSWCSLISSDQFVKTHLNLASNGGDFTRQGLILSYDRPHLDLNSCSLYSVFHEQFVNVTEIDCPLEDPDDSFWIVGSCNGLVCVASDEDSIFLWNPSTRKSKRLPEPGITLRYGCFLKYGLGYDEFNDDYKIVVIFCANGPSGGSYETEVKVYTLRTNLWRSIGDFSYGIPLDDTGKFVNGSLHWAARRDNASSRTSAIVSLDLAMETYGELVQPNYGGGGFDLTLGVLKGCLCVLCLFWGARADVWVMEEYGKTESWTRLFVVPYLPNAEMYECVKLLCILKSDEILLQFGSQLVLYNSKNGTFRNPTILNLHALYEADSYVESLVSPSTENVVQRYN